MSLKNFIFYLDLFLLSIFIIISFHFIIYDRVFFLNNLSAIFYYLTIFGLFISSLVICLKFFFKFNINLQKIFFIIIFLNIFFAFYHFVGLFFLPILKIKYEIYLRIFILMIIFYVTFLLFVKTRFNKKLDINKKFMIVKFLIVFILIINSFIFIENNLINKITENNNKKIVLIYFDGLPQSALGNYNERTKYKIINGELKNDFSLIQYNNFITSFTGTCGHFSGLFNGHNRKSFYINHGDYENFLIEENNKNKKHSKTLFTKLKKKNLK